MFYFSIIETKGNRLEQNVLFHLYRVIENSLQYLRRLWGRSFGAANVKKFYRFDTVFELTTFIRWRRVYYCDCRLLQMQTIRFNIICPIISSVIIK